MITLNITDVAPDQIREAEEVEMALAGEGRCVVCNKRCNHMISGDWVCGSKKIHEEVYPDGGSCTSWTMGCTYEYMYRFSPRPRPKPVSVRVLEGISWFIMLYALANLIVRIIEKCQ